MSHLDHRGHTAHEVRALLGVHAHGEDPPPGQLLDLGLAVVLPVKNERVLYIKIEHS